MAITLDGTNGILSPDFEPSSSTTPTNGLFLPTTNALGFATNSTEQLRLDASGNLGLGVTPNAWISTTKNFEFTSGSIYSTTNGRNLGLFQNAYVNSSASYIYVASRAATWYNQTAGAHIWYNAPSGTAGAAISFTQAMTLDASGNLGIGTTSASRKLHVYGVAASGNIGIRSENNDSTGATTFEPAVGGISGSFGLNGTGLSGAVGGAGNIIIANYYASGGVSFLTGGNTERARIDSSGNFIVGATGVRPSLGASLNQGNGTNQWELFVGNTSSANTSFGIEVYSNAVSAYRFQVGMGGTIYATSTSITAISDISLKENIRPLETGLAEVLALQPRRFDWKNGDGNNVAGFIAQEVETVLPDLVSDYKYNEEETKRGLKMGDMIPTLVKAIQELTAKVTALEAK